MVHKPASESLLLRSLMFTLGTPAGTTPTLARWLNFRYFLKVPLPPWHGLDKSNLKVAPLVLTFFFSSAALAAALFSLAQAFWAKLAIFLMLLLPAAKVPPSDPATLAVFVHHFSTLATSALLILCVILNFFISFFPAL